MVQINPGQTAKHTIAAIFKISFGGQLSDGEACFSEAQEQGEWLRCFGAVLVMQMETECVYVCVCVGGCL